MIHRFRLQPPYEKFRNELQRAIHDRPKSVHEAVAYALTVIPSDWLKKASSKDASSKDADADSDVFNPTPGTIWGIDTDDEGNLIEEKDVDKAIRFLIRDAIRVTGHSARDVYFFLFDPKTAKKRVDAALTSLDLEDIRKLISTFETESTIDTKRLSHKIIQMQPWRGDHEPMTEDEEESMKGEEEGPSTLR